MGFRAEVLCTDQSDKQTKNKQQKNDKEMTKKEQQPFYVSPQMRTLEIKPQAIICQSGGNRSMGEIELDEDDFEQM